MSDGETRSTSSGEEPPWPQKLCDSVWLIAAACGAGLVGAAVPFARDVSPRRARRLFVGTLLYLPAVYGLLLMGDSVP